MPVGQLVVTLAASIADFQADLGKATAVAEANARRMSKAFESVQHTLEGLGVAVTVVSFVELIKSTIDASEHLLHLSEATGIAVETLGGIAFAAKQSGTDLDGVAHSISKFNISIAQALDGNVKAQHAFAALGISMQTLKTSSPDQVLANTADAFVRYADGPNKDAIANALFSKSYQSIIPLLDQGGAKLQENIAYFQKYGGVSEVVSQQSSAFNEELGKISLLSSAFAKTLVADLLPQMQALATVFLESKENGTQFRGEAQHLADVLTNLAVGGLYVVHAFDSVGTAIGAAAARARLLGQFRLKDFWNFGDDEQKDVDAAGAKFDAMIKRIRDAQEGVSGAYDPRLDTGAPGKKKPPPGLGVGNLSRAGTSGALDAFYKAQAALAKAGTDAAAKIELDAIANQAADLQRSYDQGIVGFQAYWDSKTALEAKALAVQEKQLQDDVTIQTKFVVDLNEALKAVDSTPYKTAADRTNALNNARAKLLEGVAKMVTAEGALTVAEQKGAEQAKATLDARKKAAEDYQHQLDAINAELLILQGNSAAAFKLSFDDSHQDKRAQYAADASGSNPAVAAAAKATLANLDAIERQGIAQAKLNDLQKVYGQLTDQLGISQAYVDLQQSTGNIGELSALAQKSQFVRDYIGLLTVQVEKQKAVAAEALANNAPDATALVLQAEKSELALKQLAATADSVKTKLDDIFTGNLTTALDDIVTHTKTVRQAFDDMAKSMLASITHLVDDDLVKRFYKLAFGEGGATGGVSPGGFLSSLFSSATATPAATAGKSWISGQDLPGGADLASAATSTGVSAFSTSIIAATPALDAFTLSMGVANPAIDVLTTSAAAAAAALDAMAISAAASSTTSSASTLSNVAALAVTAAAGGTDYAGGGMYLIGERGPEIMNVPRGSRITPNNAIGKSGTTHVVNAPITINVPAGTAHASASQIAIKNAREVSRAASRMGQ